MQNKRHGTTARLDLMKPKSSLSFPVSLLLIFLALVHTASATCSSRRQAGSSKASSERPDAAKTAKPAPDAASLQAKAPTRAPLSPPPPSVDPDNRGLPSTEDEDFTRRARSLLSAVAANDPSLAEGFFFPRKPFTPLKAARNPDRYWLFLISTFRKDIQTLHRTRPSARTGVFESIKLASKPVWIRPGVEHNRIGYYRIRGARIFYRSNTRRFFMTIHTIISWNGKWYITHLLPIRRASIRKT